MSKIWIIAKHEYRVNVLRPGFIIVTALIPLLGALALLVATLYGGQAGQFLERQFVPQDQVIGVADHYGAFTPILPAYQPRYRSFSDDDAGRAALRADEISSLLIVPADYLTSGKVQVVMRGGNITSGAMQDSNRTRQFMVDHLLAGRVDPALAERAADPMEPVLVSLDQDKSGGTGTLGMVVNMLVPYFLGMLLVITIFTSSGYLLRSVSEEKANRVIEIVISSVTAPELLAGKVLGLGAVGLTQVVVWLLSAVVLSGGAIGLLGIAIPVFSRPEVFVLALVYYVLGFLVYAMLMGAAGSLGTTQQESQQIAGMLSMIAAVPFMIAGFMFANPNMVLARVLSWFPLTAPTMMLLRIPMSEVPVIDVVGSILLLLVAVPFLLWAGAKVFRMGLLMYGKRPGLREIWRSLRQA